MSTPIVYFPGAVWKPISRNFGGKRASTRGVILHVDAGNANSLQGWFNNPAAKASSHLYVKKDGTIEQYLSMDATAWTSGSGSATTVGVETQGLASGEWTREQVESLVRIVQWCHATYDIPYRAMTSSKASESGVGWHVLGVPATRAQKAAGVSQTGGQLWSSSVGKVCPGPDRIKQIPGIIAAAAGGSPVPRPNPEPAPAPAPAREYPAIPLLVDEDFGPRTLKALQIVLPSKYNGGATLPVTGVRDAATITAVQRWMAALGYYKGIIEADRGQTPVWGVVLDKALQAFLYGKGLYRNGGYSKSVMVDGRFKGRSISALQTYLNDQRRFIA